MIFDKSGRGYILPNILRDRAGIVPDPLDIARVVNPWYQVTPFIPANVTSRIPTVNSMPQKTPAVPAPARFGSYFEIIGR